MFGRVLAVTAGLALSLTTGCERSETSEVTRQLAELERLTFVPAFEVMLPPRASDRYSNCSITEPIVFDRFELTRSQLREYYARFAPDTVRRADEVAWTTSAANGGEDSDDWPAFLSWDEATRVAQWRDMRLPTAREWIHVAVGRHGLSYPWGNDQVSVANTVELGIGQPTPVGTFENGRNRLFDAYDLVGNVWEWVAGPVPGYRDDEIDLAATPSRAPRPFSTAWNEEAAYLTGPDRRVSVLGGSFLTKRHPTYGAGLSGGSGRILFHARRLGPETLSPDIGARMCADARPYLREHAGEFGRGEDARARVIAVGRRWAHDATARDGLIALLEELRTTMPEAGADTTGIEWLLEGARSWTRTRASS